MKSFNVWLIKCHALAEGKENCLTDLFYPLLRKTFDDIPSNDNISFENFEVKDEYEEDAILMTILLTLIYFANNKNLVETSIHEFTKLYAHFQMKSYSIKLETTLPSEMQHRELWMSVPIAAPVVLLTRIMGEFGYIKRSSTPKFTAGN